MRPTVGRQIIALILFFAIVAAIAGFGGLTSSPNIDGWYAEATKVAWNPPNWVFGPAWTIFYTSIAIVGFLVWRAGFDQNAGRNAARRTLTIYIVHLALNAVWTPVFFAGYPLIGKAAWGISLAISAAMIATVIWLAVLAAKWSKVAVWLLMPYLGWLIYAATLNAGLLALN